MGDFVDEWKIFVGGLSWDTNEDKLRNYFSEFGEITECLIMKNPDTGKSRGFGFVTFLDPNSVKKVLRVSNHELDGRIIDPKECNPRANGKLRKEYKNSNTSKIFLGGLPPNVNETYLREFFSKYGKVTEAIVMFDQEKRKSRGFGFLSLDNEEAINKIVAERYVTINGKKVEVKRAEPQPGKSITPAPNGTIPGNMSLPYFVPPWPVWPTMMPPMNGLAPNYGPSWNTTTAAVTAAAIAATAAASNPAWPYGYPGWMAPNPFTQPTNPTSPQNAISPMHGTAVSNVPTNFMQQTNSVNALNQNATNSLSSSLSSALGNAGIANFPTEANNFLSRATAFGYPTHNAHNSNQTVAAVASAGQIPGNAWNTQGSTSSIATPNSVSVSVTHHNETASSNFNPQMQFHGSRIVSNQGYHPYRRS